MEGVLLGVLVEVAELDGVEPGASVVVGVSVFVGVPVGVGLGVGVPVALGVEVIVLVGVGVFEGDGDGTTTEAARPVNLICIASPSPAVSTVHGVEPHGKAVGPYSPRKKYGSPGFPYGISNTQWVCPVVPAGPPEAQVNGSTLIV